MTKIVKKTIDMAKVLEHSGLISDVLEESKLVPQAAREMIMVLKKYDKGETQLSNGELMTLAACLVAQIVHTTIKTDAIGCPLTDDEMRVAVWFAATQIECHALN